MKLKEIRAIAKGVKAGNFKKAELIQAIQRAILTAMVLLFPDFVTKRIVFR